MSVMEYSLQAGGKIIKVGSTKPFFDNKRKGWVTDVGIFSTTRPGDYSVAGHVQDVTVVVPSGPVEHEDIPVLSATPTPKPIPAE